MDQQQIQQFAELFEKTFGDRRGLLCSRAPGRVNLIGEHTDYNGGFVLPIAINRQVCVLFRPAERGPVRLWAQQFGEWDEFDLASIRRVEGSASGWANYPRGVAAELEKAGYRLVPIEGIICGDLPIGAGLSSSAAVEVACAGAFCAAAGVQIDSAEMALLCQRAENRFVGVNCGIMDQFVSVHARPDHALLLDCRSLQYEHVPLDSSAVRVVVCNTMVHHELGSSAYNERRASCERAARTLAQKKPGIAQLRDVTPALLARHRNLLDEQTYRRARHVVTEIRRTERAAQALKAGDYKRFGRLMYQSHRSLRDDYEVSCAELDAMVEAAKRQRGILGARMVGAGFGGCTVNLVRREGVERFVEGVGRQYQLRTGIRPEVYEFVPVGGASVGPL